MINLYNNFSWRYPIPLSMCFCPYTGILYGIIIFVPLTTRPAWLSRGRFSVLLLSLSLSLSCSMPLFWKSLVFVAYFFVPPLSAAVFARMSGRGLAGGGGGGVRIRYQRNRRLPPPPKESLSFRQRCLSIRNNIIWVWKGPLSWLRSGSYPPALTQIRILP